MEKAVSFDDVLLTPQYSEIESRNDVDLSIDVAGIQLQIPIIAANMPSICGVDMAVSMGRMGGLGIIHRMQTIKEQASMVLEAKAKLNVSEGFDRPVGAAIGIGSDWERRAWLLNDAGVDIICLDVAHGAQKAVLDVYKKFRDTYPKVPLIVGNFAFVPGEMAAHIGEDPNTIIKAGVGGGSCCSTRIATGHGWPTLYSIFNVHMAGGENPVIADGGIRSSGDAVKCLAAGADLVMLGSVLAGSEEAPGSVIKGTDGEKYKVYRGAASYGAKKEFFDEVEYIEGVETLVKYKGPVQKIIKRFCEGVRSGLSYCGARNIRELQQKARFVQITSAGQKESMPHGLL